jgi:hypothetical protein
MLDRIKIKLIKSGWIRFDTKKYWDRRYGRGGDSGEGSKGHLALFKAEFLNRFVADHQIKNVVELGCGDGSQLLLANYPEYDGFDISIQAIQSCLKKFKGDKTKRFELLTRKNLPEGKRGQWDLALSLDVIYHLIGQKEFEQYLRTLFSLSKKYVIIYAPDRDSLASTALHVKYRKFSEFITMLFPEWKLILRVPNKMADQTEGAVSQSEFFIYHKSADEVVDSGQ